MKEMFFTKQKKETNTGFTWIVEIAEVRKANKKNSSVIFTTGFTLVELLVAIAIFTVIMVIAMGGVVSILSAYKKTQSIQSAMTNLNFTLETMTRDIRFGKDYVETSNGIEVIFRKDGEDKTIRYFLRDQDGKKEIIRRVNGVDQNLTADTENVSIDDLDFYIAGNSTDDGQPRVLFIVTGTAGVGQTATQFTLQTLASQRLLDAS